MGCIGDVPFDVVYVSNDNLKALKTLAGTRLAWWSTRDNTNISTTNVLRYEKRWPPKAQEINSGKQFMYLDSTLEFIHIHALKTRDQFFRHQPSFCLCSLKWLSSTGTASTRVGILSTHEGGVGSWISMVL